MSVFFTDTDCELPVSVAKELNLNNVILMPYTICGEERFYDFSGSYNAKEFFTKIRNGNMPITSGLNEQTYIDYFEPYFKRNEDILYVSFSSKMSSTFTYMDKAVASLSEKYPLAKFTRFDTKAISMAAGLIVYVGAKMFNEGKSNEEIVDFLNGFAPRINAVFSVGDLFHLKRGGRLNTVSAVLGTLLQLKPIIRLNDEGALYNSGKVNGRNKALSAICKEVVENVTDVDKYPIVILNADCAEDAQKIEARIRESFPNATIWSCDVGPVIGTHCGPDTIACCYVGTKRSLE